MGGIGLQISGGQTDFAAKGATGRTLTDPRRADLPPGASEDVARQGTRGRNGTAGTARSRNAANATRRGAACGRSAHGGSAHARGTRRCSALGRSAHGGSARARSAAGCSATCGCVAAGVARAVVPTSGRATRSRATCARIAARAVRTAASACGTARTRHGPIATDAAIGATHIGGATYATGGSAVCRAGTPMATRSS
jgi:hypothetical protein